LRRGRFEEGQPPPPTPPPARQVQIAEVEIQVWMKPGQSIPLQLRLPNGKAARVLFEVPTGAFPGQKVPLFAPAGV
jgi:hypothetical protein